MVENEDFSRICVGFFLLLSWFCPSLLRHQVAQKKQVVKIFLRKWNEKHPDISNASKTPGFTWLKILVIDKILPQLSFLVYPHHLQGFEPISFPVLFGFQPAIHTGSTFVYFTNHCNDIWPRVSSFFTHLWERREVASLRCQPPLNPHSPSLKEGIKQMPWQREFSIEIPCDPPTNSTCRWLVVSVSTIAAGPRH